MNNKVQSHFRARVMDQTKPMPIYREEETHHLHNFPAITRMMQDIPTGMEKNEEKELHLIKAMDGGQPIPVPEVESVPYHLSPYVMPKQLIQTHPFPLDEEGPDYDADSEDERFLKDQKGLTIDVDKFEKMIATFENTSTRTVLTLDEAKSLFPKDLALAIAVYEYWLNKRLRLKNPLIPIVPTENARAKNQAYVAFRKRIDKRVTRRNRRNDENSYYRILHLKADFEKVLSMTSMIVERDTKKRELIRTDMDILTVRYRAQDFNEAVYRHVLREEAIQAQNRPAPARVPKPKYVKPKKPKVVVERKPDEDENNPFVFRRKLGCSYLPPVSDGLARYPEDCDRFEPISLDGETVILARPRLGRCGRVILDRKIPSTSIYVDSNILGEIQSRAMAEIHDWWSFDVENLEDGTSTHCEFNIPSADFRHTEHDREVVYPRGKKSFTDHLNEIRYRSQESQESL